MKLAAGFILSFLLYTVSGCHSPEGSVTKQGYDSSYHLIGKIAGMDSGWVFLMHASREPRVTDSLKSDSGKFVFSGKLKEPELCILGIYEKGMKQFKLGFFLDTGTIHLSGSKDSLDKSIVRGSAFQDEYKRFLASMKPIEDKENELGKIYDSLHKKGDKKAMDSIDKKFPEIDRVKKNLAKDYARQHPSSIIAAFEIYDQYFIEPDANELDSVYRMLDSATRSSFYGKRIKEVLDKTRVTAIGNPAPEFTMNDPAGNQIKLSGFRGKFLLIDFWASWCGPCRAENPNVVKVYHQYHPKGFEILGVSLDDKKDNWEKSIRKDRLNWTQVSDLKGWKNNAAVQYGVNAIPTNFLLDKEGKIIAKGLRGEELGKKLHELMN